MAEGDKERSVMKVEAICTFTYKTVDQIKYSWGSGQSGSLIFKGLFNERIPIALKRYQKVSEEKKDKVEVERELSGENKVQVKRELEFLSSAKNRHPNLIRYFGNATDDNFWYLQINQILVVNN